MFGEPPKIIHPVVWIGKIIGFFTCQIKKWSRKGDARLEKTLGSVFALSLVTSIGTISYLMVAQSFFAFGAVVFVLLSAVILKSMFSIKSMDRHIMEILDDIQKNNIEKARNDLSRIVSRDTRTLPEEKILSACIECIAESFVDGILSPLFYYGFLNIPGAVAFRVANTLDSMIGYKDKQYKDIGWMSAKMDTMLNLIPSRLSIVFLVASSLFLMQDWKNAILVCKRDGRNTESLNAGIPMSIVAGALRIQLEKINHYKLGDMHEPITVAKCKTTLKITKIATFVFLLGFLFPITFLLDSSINWWSMFFGF